MNLSAHAVQCCKMNERFPSDPVLDPMEREAFHDSFRNKQFVERLESFRRNCNETRYLEL
jgi:hypothetical protein